MPDQITLALLLTPGGGVVAAAVIRQLIEVLKVAIPGLDARVSGALQATIASLVLYVVVWLTAGALTAESGFVAFLGWLGCSAAAIGINSAIDHVARVTNTAARTAYIPRTDGKL